MGSEEEADLIRNIWKSCFEIGRKENRKSFKMCSEKSREPIKIVNRKKKVQKTR